MRILLVAPQPFFEERGTPIAVRLMAQTLRDAGHEIDLLVYHAGVDPKLPGVRVVRAGRPWFVRHVPIGVSWQKLACDAALICRMAHLMWTRRYDVIHAVEESVFPAVVLNWRRRSRLVYDMDSLLSQQLVQKWTALQFLMRFFVALECFAVRRCDAVLAVCEDLAEGVRRYVPEANVKVATDVPLDGFGAPANPDDLRALTGAEGVLALYVGNLEYYQGVDMLIDAMALLPADVPVTLVVVGGTRPDIERCALRLQPSARNRVHFLGPRPTSHLAMLLAQADILVSPRLLGQNTPMKVYSYMGACKAILATAIRSHTQVLDRSCALLVDASAQAMANGLQQLAQDAALRAQLGEAAASRVAERYSVAAFRRVVLDTYRDLAVVSS